MDEPTKSTEQEASEALAEAEVENGVEVAARLRGLEERLEGLKDKIDAWDEIVLDKTGDELRRAKLLHELAKNVAELRRIVHNLLEDLKGFHERLRVLEPSYVRQKNCPKCGSIIRSAGGQCSVCR